MIPTREQFIELNIALNRSTEYLTERLSYPVPFPERATVEARSAVEARLGYPITLRADLTSVLTKEELQNFIRGDVDSYLEQSEVCQQLFAWKWLHEQQNFIKAKNRIFRHWPTEDRVGNGLERHIAEYVVNFFVRGMEEKQQLVSRGVEYAPKTHEAWMVNRDPLEIFQTALRSAGRWAVRYRSWVAGVIVALSNYHYGKTAEMAVNRKNRVGALIAAWENLNEQIALSQSDPELGEYLQRSVLILADNLKLNELRALHQNDALYFIGRADETVSERLFIRELAILHRALFYKKLCTSAILDLFYLEGMKSAPTERAIQRVAKSAIANWREIGEVKSEVRKLSRH